MWKESYRIGVEIVDQQHHELFKMVDRLLRVIRVDKSATHREEYVKTLDFMKNYVVSHFREEEAYQASIHYAGIEAHKEEHHKFTQTVVNYENNFKANGYTAPAIKAFAGTLVSWLIYHVAKEDQKLTGGALEEKIPESALYLECFYHSISEVLQKMTGIKTLHMEKLTPTHHAADGDIFVHIDFVGDMDAAVLFAFPRELAFLLIGNMTFMEVTEIDELVCSAMAEIVNIASGNVATALARQKLICDIKPPRVCIDAPTLDKDQYNGIRIRTENGDFQILYADL